VVYEPIGEVKDRFLFGNKETIILQKFDRISKEKS
jgi:hypothetical protein